MAFDLDELGYVRDEQGCFVHPMRSDTFWYNEGDSEEDWVAFVIRSARDRGVYSRELLQGIRDYQSSYQLSQRRANLLVPVAQYITGEVLEVGAGMGAITRGLGETGAVVCALEASPRRAAACAERTADLDNVQVVCDTIQRFDAPGAFDTVVCVGVLEYSKAFGFQTEGGDPVLEMLSKLHSYLRPGGRLILAIENQLGLKYLLGVPEDHVGQPMYGVEDRYGDGDSPAITFGRLELQGLLREADFAEQQWYYPFPDYKLPSIVLADRALEVPAPIDALPLLELGSVGSDPNGGEPHGELARVWGPVLRNGLARDLANSFLVVASPEPIPDATDLAWVFSSTEQSSSFAKVATFSDGGEDVSVSRRPLVLDQPRRVGAFERTFPGEPYYRSDNWASEAQSIVGTDGWRLGELEAWFKTWFDAVVAEAGLPPDAAAESVIPGDLFDAIPRNMVMAGDGPKFIDLEVRYHDELTLEDMAYRALQDLTGIDVVAEPSEGTPSDRRQIAESMLAAVGVSADDAGFAKHTELETAFYESVFGVSVPLADRFEGPLGSAGVHEDAPLIHELELTRVELAVARKRAILIEKQRDQIVRQRDQMSAELTSLRKESAELAERVEELSAGVEALRSTTSWKVTRPLRAIRALAQKRD